MLVGRRLVEPLYPSVIDRTTGICVFQVEPKPVRL